MFHLPAPLKKIETTCSWKGIKFQGPDSLRPETVDIDAAGPMFRITRPNKKHFLIFSPNYSPMQGNFQNQQTLILQFSGNPMIMHTFVFPSVELMESFMIFYLESVNSVSRMACDMAIPSFTFNECLMGLMPEEKSLSLLKVSLNQSSLCAVMEKEDAKGKKKHKSSHPVTTTLTFPLAKNIVAAPAFMWSPTLGNQVLMERTFMVKDISGKTELQVITQTPEAAMLWVIGVHLAIARASGVRMVPETPKPSPAPTTKPEAGIAPKEEPKAAPPPAQEVESEEPKLEERERKVSDIEVEIETEYLSIPTEDVEVSVESVKEPVPSAKEVNNKSRPRLMSRRAGNNETKEDKRPRISFLPDGPTPGLLMKEYKEFLKSHQPVHPEKVVMPDLKTILVDTSRESVTLDNTSIDAQIQHALDCLSVMDDEKIQTNLYEKVETSTLVENILKQYDFDEKIDFDSLIDFGAFPAYDKMELVDSVSPFTPFVNDLSAVVESINLMDTKVLYYDNETSRKLVFLVASLLLNGLKGLKELSNRELLIPAMRELQEFCPGFKDIVDRASKESDVASQASVIASMLLNTNNLVPFLKQVTKHDSWISKYYHVSAQIASESLIDMTIAMLTPVMSSVEFLLGERPRAVSGADASDVSKFITSPAFGYLEMSEVNSEEQLVSALSKQLLYGVKQSKSQGYGILPPEFQFIVAVAKQKHASNDTNWQQFVDETTAISDQALSSANRQNLHEDWIRSSLNHGNLLPRLLYLVLSKDVVADFYHEYASMRDPYRANYVIRQVARVLKSSQ